MSNDTNDRGRGYDRSAPRRQADSGETGGSGVERRARMILLIDRLVSFIGIAFCIIVALVVLVNLLGPLGLLDLSNWGLS